MKCKLICTRRGHSFPNLSIYSVTVFRAYAVLRVVHALTPTSGEGKGRPDTCRLWGTLDCICACIRFASSSCCLTPSTASYHCCLTCLLCSVGKSRKCILSSSQQACPLLPSAVSVDVDAALGIKVLLRHMRCVF